MAKVNNLISSRFVTSPLDWTYDTLVEVLVDIDAGTITGPLNIDILDQLEIHFVLDSFNALKSKFGGGFKVSGTLTPAIIKGIQSTPHVAVANAYTNLVVVPLRSTLFNASGSVDYDNGAANINLAYIGENETPWGAFPTPLLNHGSLTSYQANIAISDVPTSIVGGTGVAPVVAGDDLNLGYWTSAGTDPVAGDWEIDYQLEYFWQLV